MKISLSYMQGSKNGKAQSKPQSTVGRVLSFFSSGRNWDSPNPSPAGECAPHPLVRGEGHTRQGERGWGRRSTSRGSTGCCRTDTSSGSTDCCRPDKSNYSKVCHTATQQTHLKRQNRLLGQTRSEVHSMLQNRRTDTCRQRQLRVLQDRPVQRQHMQAALEQNRYVQRQHRLLQKRLVHAAQAALEQIRPEAAYASVEKTRPGSTGCFSTDMSSGSIGCCSTDTSRGSSGCSIDLSSLDISKDNTGCCRTDTSGGTRQYLAALEQTCPGTGHGLILVCFGLFRFVSVSFG